LSRILALDYGEARCGCALSDPSCTLASPIEVIDAPGSDEGIARIARLVADRGVESVVVGLPVGLSGREGMQALEVREFAERLAAVLPVPVDTYDERFTTKLAENVGGRAPADSRAAAILLESYLRAREPGSGTNATPIAPDSPNAA
jgi:putative Holliday junction resolvase